MKILNFGSINWDHCYYLDHLVLPGETIASNAFETKPGGKGLNQSIALARAGVNVYHAGLYGEGGQELKDFLMCNNVETTFLEKIVEPQGHANIQIDNSGENSIVLYKGSNDKISENLIHEVLNSFSKNDLILLQNEINGIDKIIDFAYEKGLKVALNPAPMSENIKNLNLNKIEWLFINEIEGHELTQKHESNEILKELEKRNPNLNVILTLGAKGAKCKFGKRLYFQKAIKTISVDSTGAGDTFIGYFIAGLKNEIDIQENLKIASAAASLCVTKKGAANAIPYIKEVIELLNKKTEEK